MKTLEDRLRDAYSAVAGTVDPQTIPAPPARPRPRAAMSRWMRVAVPLAAATAVILVVTVSTLLASGPAPHHPRPAKRHHTPAAVSFPAFTLVNLGPSVKVYDTRTGAVVATLKPPRGQQFEDVTSGGTAQTFLAATGASGSACHAYFYRFTLSAAGQPSALTRLRSVPNSQPTAITATAGDGYAYSTVRCAPAPGAIGISGPSGHRTWAYPEGDDYTFSLAATADGHTLALSMQLASGNKDLLLNTGSTAATVAGASRVLPGVPSSTTLAISPDGQTIYACAANGAAGTLAAYSAATGAQIRVLHQWPLPAQGFFCQISADPAGRFLIAAVTSNVQRRSTLTGFDLRTGASVTLRVHPALILQGSQVAW